MRILHVNKFLYRRGGAEAYMEDLADLQVAAGHTVAFFGMAHPLNTHLEYAAHFPPHIELEPPPPTLTGRVRGVARMLYSTAAHRGMDAVLAEFRPDVVHLHNIYHQLSPSVLRPVARRRVPAVMTLHDYKLACPTYQFLDHGNLCQACLGGHFQHAILRRCKDGSLGSSAVMAGELFMHTITGAYAPVRVFICPSRFLEGRMRAAGVFPRRMAHVPHFIETRDIPVKPTPGSGVLLAGRLSPEKGVDVAIRAAGAIDGAVLDIAGTGPEEASLQRACGLGRSRARAVPRPRGQGRGPAPHARRGGRGRAVALVRESADGRARGACSRCARGRQRPRRDARVDRSGRNR